MNDIRIDALFPQEMATRAETLGMRRAEMPILKMFMLAVLAIWLTHSARSTVDKILAILFPITAFVAAGFEHSVANMYFIPYALSIKYFDPQFVATVGDRVSNLDLLTWQAFFMKNLIPVTIGNIIGGAVLVAAVYWAIYLRPVEPK